MGALDILAIVVILAGVTAVVFLATSEFLVPAEDRKAAAREGRAPTALIRVRAVVGWAVLLLVGSCNVIGLSLGLGIGVLDELFDPKQRSSPLGRLKLTLLLLAIGGAFYLLRRKNLRVYAVTELSIAVVSAHSGLAEGKDLYQPAGWLPLAGAVYLVVRGLDNLFKKPEVAVKSPVVARGA